MKGYTYFLTILLAQLNVPPCSPSILSPVNGHKYLECYTILARRIPISRHICVAREGSTIQKMISMLIIIRITQAQGQR